MSSVMELHSLTGDYGLSLNEVVHQLESELNQADNCIFWAFNPMSEMNNNPTNRSDLYT